MTSGRAHRTVAALLGDPLVQLVMRADGVDPQALASELGAIATRLRPRKPASVVSRPASRAKWARLCRQRHCHA